MLPVVVIELAQPAEDPALIPGLLDACSRVLADGECVLAPKAAEGELRASARVTFVTPDAVRLEVQLPSTHERLLRDLAFRSEDATADRWRAIGLVIGTLAGMATNSLKGAAEGTTDDELAPGDAASSADSPPASGAVPPTEAPEASRPVQPSPRDGEPQADAPIRDVLDRTQSVRRAWVAVVATTGPGFDSGPWRLGAEARGAFHLGAPFVTAAVAYAGTLGSEGGLSASWFEGALGAGFRLSLGSAAALYPRADGLLQRLGTNLVEPATGDRDEGARWLPGVRLATDVAVWLTDDVAVVAGVEGRWLAGATDVSARGRIVATESTLRLGAFAGLRYAF